MGERTHWIPAEYFGLSEEEVADAEVSTAYNFAKERKKWAHFTPEFVDTKIGDMKVDQAMRWLDEGQTNYRESSIYQYEAEVKFNTDLPVTIFGMGDFHLGSVYTDHNEVMRKLQLIQDTPNAYLVFMSNLIDNAIPGRFPDGMLQNTMPPDRQVVLMRKIAQELNAKGKILGAVRSSCHEGWTGKVAGQDINAMMFGFPERRFPILENGGEITLKFPGFSKLMGLYHKVGPFESNFNETHALRQMNRLNHQMRLDIVWGAHKHNTASLMTYEGVGTKRRPVFYARTGCEKGTGDIHDAWSMDRYGASGEPTGPSITILPNGDMDHHLEFDMGILAQEAYICYELYQKAKP